MACLVGLVAALPAAAEPVLTKTDDGVIDWTTRTVRAVGVGTPRVLSPTGGLTPRALYDVARDDAEKRIGRLLARLPIDGRRRLRDLDALDTRRDAIAKAHTAAETRHFADGTVHLPASAPFAWVAAEWPADDPPAVAVAAAVSDTERAGEPLPVVGPPLPGETGLVIQLDGPIEPTARLTMVTPGGAILTAGTTLDALGPEGTVFAGGRADVDLTALVGDTPLTVAARPGQARGELKLLDEALVGRRLPGAVIVLMPVEGR